MIKPGEQGAALLSVLLLVAVMGGIAAASFDRLRLATNLEANAAALEQARNFAIAGELLAATRIDDLIAREPGRTTLAGDWNGRTMVLPLPVGTARVTVRDGGNCFNLNSVVMNDPPSPRVIRPRGVQQFVALLGSLGLLEGDARRIAAALVDWIDSCFPCYLFAECPEDVKPKQGKSNDDCSSDDDDSIEDRDSEQEEVSAQQRRKLDAAVDRSTMLVRKPATHLSERRPAEIPVGVIHSRRKANSG